VIGKHVARLSEAIIILKGEGVQVWFREGWIAMENLDTLIIGIGPVLIIVSFPMWFLADKLSWFSSLPGDPKIERSNFQFWGPITTMIFISVLSSFLLWLIGRFFT